ncbi:hypothetical protein NX773_03070 [Massilia solisilvae]|uniref:Transmembrane protein n=1 Tax=Massilia solisilvae TaxID=1811225 RepID=A0ABT2BF51_9BURK|nr:hypothetical protein [Massilia solisilvae]MCS0607146.1 hypothetical protein [Massilia solisilvae]
MQLLSRSLLLSCALLTLSASAAPKRDDGQRFAVIGHSFISGGEEHLKAAIAETSEKSLAFVVVAGIKGVQEGCVDKLYQQRRELIDNARRPMVVLPAASDWTECKNSAGRSNAIERLARLRELFYAEQQSLGEKKIALTRQSMSPRFRSYAENAHWEVGKVLYATINLPSNNNHYLPAAGRNSEYEDRLVANRFWLNRLFAIARSDKVEAIVLFSEGDLKPFSEPTGLRALLRRAPAGHDGFAEPRRQVLALAQKFAGKVLLVDSAGLPKGAKPGIEWRGNVGHLSVGPGALEVRVQTNGEPKFAVKDAAD